MIIVFTPALYAPIDFSFKPPIGRTLPVKVISPVKAYSFDTGLLVKQLIISIKLLVFYTSYKILLLLPKI